MLRVINERHADPRPTDVVLVDGVGWGAWYLRRADCLQIQVGSYVFVKTREVRNGRDVYRLEGAEPRPRIRCVLGRLSLDTPDDHLGARGS